MSFNHKKILACGLQSIIGSYWRVQRYFFFHAVVTAAEETLIPFYNPILPSGGAHVHRLLSRLDLNFNGGLHLACSQHAAGRL